MQRGFFAGLVLLTTLLSTIARADSWTLKIGETRRLPLPASNSVWIQNKKILNVKSLSGVLLVTGSGEGTTNLQVGEKTYRVQVIQPAKKTLLKKFEKEVKSMLGLRAQIHTHQVTVTGKLYRWEDWVKLAKISSDLGVSYVMSAQIPEALKQRVQDHWQQEFTQLGLPAVPVLFGRYLQARIFKDTSLYSKYEEILEPFGVRLEKDLQSLEIAPVVKVEITVAEVSRDFALNYGLQWPDTYRATLLSDGQKEFSNLVFNAKAFEKQGQGKILASPNLLCRSGKEAEFLAGGEFPIKISSYKSNEVIWKKYGVLLKVKPKADSSGRMSIALEVEVSTIDGARMADGIPGFLTNRISSHFDLSRSQTIALSGLIKNEDSKSTEGVPLISRLPILGSLFSSRDFKENRTELVIFVRPSIVQDGPANSRQHLGELSYE